MTVDALLEQLADRVAEKVAARLNGNGHPPEAPTGEPMLTPTAVAKQLGTSARWVYDHADELGGKRLTRPCLRFPDVAGRGHLERRRGPRRPLPAPPPATERRDFGHLSRRGATWWIRYSVGGKRYRESTRSSSEREAEKFLARREAELAVGSFTTPDVKRTTFADLEQMIRDEYVVQGYRSLDRVDCSFKQLATRFAGVRANAITLDRLTRYVRERLEAGAALGTVWNELKALKTAFHLAQRAGRVARVPAFPTLEGADNVRTGFFEEADFRAVLGELAPPLRAPLEFAYFTGWRIPSEVLVLTWAQVDFAAGLVRLEVGTTKGKPGKRE